MSLGAGTWRSPCWRRAGVTLAREWVQGCCGPGTTWWLVICFLCVQCAKSEEASPQDRDDGIDLAFSTHGWYRPFKDNFPPTIFSVYQLKWLHAASSRSRKGPSSPQKGVVERLLSPTQQLNVLARKRALGSTVFPEEHQPAGWDPLAASAAAGGCPPHRSCGLRAGAPVLGQKRSRWPRSGRQPRARLCFYGNRRCCPGRGRHRFRAMALLFFSERERQGKDGPLRPPRRGRRPRPPPLAGRYRPAPRRGGKRWGGRALPPLAGEPAAKGGARRSASGPHWRRPLLAAPPERERGRRRSPQRGAPAACRETVPWLPGGAGVGGKGGAAPVVFVNTAGRPFGGVAKGPSVRPRPALPPPRRARSGAEAGTWRAAAAAPPPLPPPRRRAPARRRWWSGSG